MSLIKKEHSYLYLSVCKTVPGRIGKSPYKMGRMKAKVNAEAANGFITCQPSHTLKMAREILLSVMLIISFLYFLGVVYIFFTDAECNVGVPACLETTRNLVGSHKSCRRQPRCGAT